MLVKNVYYSSPKAAQHLAIPELLWALKLVGEVRHCYPDILSSLHANEVKVVPYCYTKKSKFFFKTESFQFPVQYQLCFIQFTVFWNLISADWLAFYTTEPAVFIWIRALIWKFLRKINTSLLVRLLKLLLPWRRELQRKIFTEVSDLAHIIDFTVSPVS